MPYDAPAVYPRMFRFRLLVEMPSHVSDREKDYLIGGETLEAAQADLEALPGRFLPAGAPPTTPWKLLSVREVFPPNYE